MTLVTRNHPKLTLEGARAVLAAAESRAREIGVPMDIAVVDDGGCLLAFARMDGAKPSSVDIAINKAVSAAIRGQPSGPYLEAGQPNFLVSFALAIGSRARQTPLRGGLPRSVRRRHRRQQRIRRSGRGRRPRWRFRPRQCVTHPMASSIPRFFSCLQPKADG